MCVMVCMYVSVPISVRRRTKRINHITKPVIQTNFPKWFYSDLTSAVRVKKLHIKNSKNFLIK